VICEIDVPEGASLVAGKAREVLSELEGRAYKPTFPDLEEESTKERVKVAWVVRAPTGATVTVTARHPRAGRVTAALELA
jgi:hypothetical protein